jgi:Ca2+-binding RTX toxin-like protein
MNSGLIRGTVQLGDGNDVFNDFLKVGAHIKSGIVDRGIVLGVAAAIDLGAGDDIFNGGKNAESVRDDLGTDTYKFGAGNDLFLADDDFANSENDGNDIVNGGRGIDTYNLTGADTLYFINLDTKVHFGLEAQTAVELFGQTDRVIGFENVVGGTIADSIVGSGGANSLNGSGGGDQLCGLGGRDVLTGGSGADTFVFLTLADSGIKASTRDVITDFIAGSGDIIDLSAIDANGNAAGDPALQLHWLESFQRRAWRAQGVVQQRQYHHLRRREWRRQGRFLHRVDRICLIERRGLPFVRDRAREETDPLTHGRRRGRPTQGL